MYFAEFLNEGFPAHLRILSPPTCVGFGTGQQFLTRSFSWQCDTRKFSPPKISYLSALSLCVGDLPPTRPAAFDTLFHQCAHAFSCVTPLLKQNCQVQEYLPVVHRLCLLPRLRSRLTLSRRALLRKPSAFGGTDSHRPFRYSYRHSLFQPLQCSLRYTFSAVGTLPYPWLYP